MPPTFARRARRAALAAAALAVASAGRAAAQTTPPRAADRATDSLVAIARARQDSLLHKYTPADVHFMSTMIGHHAQAITMAKLAPVNGASPSVRTLADRIINAQLDEIATMQQWLRDRGQPAPVPDTSSVTAATAASHAMPGMDHGAMPGMAGMSSADHALMPGMLTGAQMAELVRAKGADFDRLFLTGMIQHHSGAVTMVKALFGSYGAGQDETVFKFASDVNVDQTTEIARMEQMLTMVLLLNPSPAPAH